ALDDEEKAGRAASILALVGVVNLPIIKFSVDWWNTLHQGASILREGGPSLPAEMQVPLYTLGIAYQLYFTVVVLWRMKLEINNRKILVMQQAVVSD
ncbi:MAG: heme transporter HemC, partial [Kordiimonadaceae bacterium]|nr:heme transporter HemC [Kordiimonadaceae bacterium]